MAHSDDDGLILPPKLAPIQVVIVPIYKGDDQKQQIDEKVKVLMQQLKAAGVSVKYDDNDNNRPGWKFAEYEMKGVPVRVAIGIRDLANNVVELARRDTREKMTVSIDGLSDTIIQLLDTIQTAIYNKARSFLDECELPMPITGMNL